MDKKSTVLSAILLAAMLQRALFGQEMNVTALRESTSVTYKLVHPLHRIEATSKDVKFEMRIDTAKREIKTVAANVDVTTFDSGNSSRDSHAMEVVDAITYPEVDFTSTSVAPGADSISVRGKLTFHGISKEIDATVFPAWSGRTLGFRGSFGVTLTDFKIERPSLLMIPVKDTLTFTIVGVCRW